MPPRSKDVFEEATSLFCCASLVNNPFQWDEQQQQDDNNNDNNMDMADEGDEQQQQQDAMMMIQDADDQQQVVVLPPPEPPITQHQAASVFRTTAQPQTAATAAQLQPPPAILGDNSNSNNLGAINEQQQQQLNNGPDGMMIRPAVTFDDEADEADVDDDAEEEDDDDELLFGDEEEYDDDDDDDDVLLNQDDDNNRGAFCFGQTTAAQEQQAEQESSEILLDPLTTTLHDLQALRRRCPLPRLLQACHASPRLRLLSMQLLQHLVAMAPSSRQASSSSNNTDESSPSSSTAAAAAAASHYYLNQHFGHVVLQHVTDALLQPDWLTQEAAAQVLRGLSAHECMDVYFLNNNNNNNNGDNNNGTSTTTTSSSPPQQQQQEQPMLITALSLVAQGGGPMPFTIGTTTTTATATTTSSGGEDGNLVAWVNSTAAAPAQLSSFPSTTTTTSATATASVTTTTTIPLPHYLTVTEQARIHACIALLNLSCGGADNKSSLAQCSALLLCLKTLLLDNGPSHTSQALRVKAATILKNLSNLERNDVALCPFPGLVHALGRAVLETCLGEASITVSGTDFVSAATNTTNNNNSAARATTCTTNACMALMNLSISKTFKQQVYHTPGVLQALLTVLHQTAQTSQTHVVALEARIRACSVLSNLAIGYDNKWSMLHYPGLVQTVMNLIVTTRGEVRSKACSIIWSLAAETLNQVPLVQDTERGFDRVVVPALIRVASEVEATEARQKCVAALTLLAESPANAVPLLQAGLLPPLFDILQQAGSDPTLWKDHTASWCVSCVMNVAQVDAAVPILRQAGVVQLLAPLVALDQEYQSLKAAMAVTLCCRLDHHHHHRVAAMATNNNNHSSGISADDTYNLLRQTETAIPNIVHLLFNTLAGRGGQGYKYGVFTLSSSVACIAALAAGPEFVQEHVATTPVLVSLLQVVWDFAVHGGTAGTIVGGGRDDVVSAGWALRALHSLCRYLRDSGNAQTVIVVPSLQKPLVTALTAAEQRLTQLFASQQQQQQQDQQPDQQQQQLELVQLAIQTRHLLQGTTLSTTRGPALTPRRDDSRRQSHHNQEQQQSQQDEEEEEEGRDYSSVASCSSTRSSGKRKQPDAMTVDEEEEQQQQVKNNSTTMLKQDDDHSRNGSSPVSVVVMMDIHDHHHHHGHEDHINKDVRSRRLTPRHAAAKSIVRPPLQQQQQQEEQQQQQQNGIDSTTAPAVGPPPFLPQV